MSSSPNRPPRPRLIDLAGSTGVITRREALEHGMRAREIATAALGDEWERLRRGVLVPSNRSNERLTRFAAAVAVSPGAVLSHDSAAALWGFPTWTDRADVQLTRARRPDARRTPNTTDWVRVGVARLPSHHITVRHGLPVTTAARTAVDVARTCPFPFAIAVFDAALRTELVDHESCAEAIRQARGWPGSRRAFVALAAADPRAESPGESMSRAFFAQWAIAMPEPQAVLRDGYRFVARVDFLWRSAGLVGEFDGLTKYTSPDVLRQEKVRQEDICGLGFRVIRWMSSDMWSDGSRLAERLRRHIDAPAPTIVGRAEPTSGPAPPVALHLLDNRRRRRRKR